MDKKYWLTPPELYTALDEEFNFDFDPCPYPRPDEFNGAEVPWGQSNYVNPPFRRSDGAFGAEQQKGKTSVIIINTMSFINLLLEAGAECRSMGRVRWLDCRTGEPWRHPSNTTVFVLRGKEAPMPVDTVGDPWIGVDLDGTLAYYDGWKGPDHIGEPIDAMVARVTVWISQGKRVKIFTARASLPSQIPPIQEWLRKHGMPFLEITNVKDMGMTELWDDRCVQVIPNTGKPVTFKRR